MIIFEPKIWFYSFHMTLFIKWINASFNNISANSPGKLNILLGEIDNFFFRILESLKKCHFTSNALLFNFHTVTIYLHMSNIRIQHSQLFQLANITLQAFILNKKTSVIKSWWPCSKYDWSIALIQKFFKQVIKLHFSTYWLLWTVVNNFLMLCQKSCCILCLSILNEMRNRKFSEFPFPSRSILQIKAF